MDAKMNGSKAESSKGEISGELQQLERQVERASFFAHASLKTVSTRLDGVETMVADLIEALRQGGIVVSDDDDEDELSLEEQSPTQPRIPWPGLALRPEAEEEVSEPVVEVNCAERMHICHAVCCKLHFALSASEVEAGKIKWDLGYPYVIRHETDDYCTHNDRTTGGCGIYDDRPQVCRRYSCANDPRIWTDFENMVLNDEWIDAHLENGGRILFLNEPTMGPPSVLGAHIRQAGS